MVGLENRVAWLESFIGTLRAASSHERDNLLQTVSFGDHLPARDAVSPLKQTREKEGGNNSNRDISANLQVDLEGSLIYHGATSIYRGSGPSTSELQTISTRPMSSESNFEYVAEHFGITLNDAIVDDALMQFFKWQYPHFMFVYREAFLRDHFGPRVDCKYWSSALLFSICALGTLMSTEKRNRESSEQFHSAAESILIVSGFSKPSIVTVQGFLCLAFYEIGRGNLSKSWGLSGSFPTPRSIPDCLFF